MILEARDVSFQYDNENRNILNHVDLRLSGGECVGLSAPSGFGKTTFLKILAGYERPNAGGVFLDGKPLDSFRGYCPVQMIWQNPELAVNPRLRMRTILEEAGPVERRVAEGLGIEPGWLERYPGELSGGELQRFCIARAEALLKDMPYEDLGYAKLDHHRALRSGFGETVFCQGKPDVYLAEIFKKFYDRDGEVLGTRASLEHYELVRGLVPKAEYDPISRILKVERPGKERKGLVAVCTGGGAPA